MLRPRNQLLIALPLVRAEAQNLTPLELLEQAATTVVSALTDEPGHDLFRLWLESVPQPSLLLLVADK
jgi:hypothetical protein